jgi:flavodoxin
MSLNKAGLAMTQIVIIYASKTGYTQTMAKDVVEGAKKAGKVIIKNVT